ncbi:MAG: hypothetical protein ACI4JJ_08730 [Huintestinicola sp.]
MKKIVILIMIMTLMIGFSGCSESENDPAVINTFTQTPEDMIEDKMNNSEEVILLSYNEMSDGTWQANGYSYKYKLEISGRLSNAEKDTTYVILSNIDDITFEQAWKASGLSSNSSDYFKTEDAVFAEIK